MKSSSLAYNRHETRDKQPLDTEPYRSWCSRHTSVKFFWSQPIDPWRSERQHTLMLPPMSMEPWVATKKSLHYCSGDTSPCPGPYLTAASPEFHIGCRLGRELFTLPVYCRQYPWSRGQRSRRLYQLIVCRPRWSRGNVLASKSKAREFKPG